MRVGEHRYNGYAAWDIKYRLIWITKYRYKILHGEASELDRQVICLVIKHEK